MVHFRLILMSNPRFYSTGSSVYPPLCDRLAKLLIIIIQAIRLPTALSIALRGVKLHGYACIAYGYLLYTFVISPRDVFLTYLAIRRTNSVLTPANDDLRTPALYYSLVW